jgi:glutathione S-transferase
MTALLVGSPTSHYVEMARWALERAGIGYREEGHLPIFSDLATLRRGKKPGVPLFVADGVKLRGSTQILRHADPSLWPADPALAAEVDRWEDRCDKELGPAARRLGFAWLLGEKDLALSLYEGSVPGYELALMRASYPLVAVMMRRKYSLDEATLTRAMEIIDALFADVGRAVAGKRYLVGDALSAADIAFACLAAPVLCPEGSGSRMPRVDEMPAGARREVERLRATPAGQFALRLIREDRRR